MYQKKKKLAERQARKKKEKRKKKINRVFSVKLIFNDRKVGQLIVIGYQLFMLSQYNK